MPHGVDVMMTRVFLPDEIVGNTEAMNSSAMPGRRNANSSRYRRFGEKPRIPSEDDAAMMIRQPLANWMDILFHSFTPGWSQNGRFR